FHVSRRIHGPAPLLRSRDQRRDAADTGSGILPCPQVPEEALMETSDRLRNLILDAITLVVIAVVLLPIIWVFIASIRPDADIMTKSLIPTRITFEHFEAIFARSDFLVALRNSLIVGVVDRKSTRLNSSHVKI